MRVHIWNPASENNKIHGFTVVVDVFRAFSTAYYIYYQKPYRYIITDSIEHAFSLREVYPSAILIGERGGYKVDGFDYGNSPTEIVSADLFGKTIVHTTTAGTKGLLKQAEKNEVVVGSFVNLAAILRYIHENKIMLVNIYCTAPEGQRYGTEDYIFAEYLRLRLLGQAADFGKIVKSIREGSGREFTDGSFAPYTDFLYCMDIDRFSFLLRKQLVREATHSVELIIA